MSLLNSGRDDGASSSESTETAKGIAEKVESRDAEPESAGSDLAVGAAAASVGLSLYEYYIRGDRERGIFVGLWAPTILAFASYLKQKSMEERLEESLVAGSTVRGLRNLLQ
jgi:hypothetical protein